MNDTAVALLKKLIACRSITPAQDGAMDLADEILTSAGYSTQRLPAGGVDNLWATNSDSPKLLFAGHVDVVPPGDLELWKSEPFTAEERDGFVYGRGAADMKSGVAVMIHVACQLRDVPGIAMLLTSDEEGPATHGTQYVVKWLKDKGVTIPYALVGEPTGESEFGDTIKIGRRGSFTARITVRGQQGHIAYPHRTDNPIPKLMNALSEILRQNEKNADKKSDDFPPTGAQVALINAGVAENVVPANATATLNFRYSPEDTPETLRQMTESCLENAAAGMWKCEWFHSASPYRTPGDGLLVRALQDGISAVCGRQANLSAAGGVSDGRFLRDICDEVAEFGVANESMHAPNERVSCDEVRMLTDIFERVARQLLQAE